MVDGPLKRLGWQHRVLRPFSRIQTSGRFIPVIDGLRFYAFMAVIAVHWTWQVAMLAPDPTKALADVRVFLNGSFGVQLFFVISGFVLALPFARATLENRDKPALTPYYTRRLTRLEPPYILNLIVYLFVYVLILHRGSFSQLFPEFLASMTYTHGLFFGGETIPNVVTWTLEIEVQFYLVAPFLARIFALDSRVARRGLLAAATVAIPLAITSLRWDSAYLYLPGNIQYFLVGFLLADIYLVEWSERPSSNAVFDLLAVSAALPLIVHNSWADNEYKKLTLPFLILAFYIGVCRGKLTRRFTENIWIATAGGMCYTIYLYHFLPIMFLARWFKEVKIAGFPAWANALLQLSLVTPLIVAFCAILFALFERPFMRREWYKRVWLLGDRAAPAKMDITA